jgi:hypothetical protein
MKIRVCESGPCSRETRWNCYLTSGAQEEKIASQRLGRILFPRFNDVPNVPSHSLEDAAQPSQNANDPGGSTVESIRAVSERS